LYENEGSVTLGWKGIVATTKDGIRTLCNVEAVKIMVAQTSDGDLRGGNSPVVTIIVGIEEFPEGVTTFVSIVACDTFQHL
jgi:hypothetical protein